MKKFLFWFLAFVITIGAAVYQRKTGPTYPKDVEVNVNGQAYDVELVRSLALDEDPEVKLAITDTSLKARIFYKRFRTVDEYRSEEFSYRSDEQVFFANVPQQPPAGKIQYYIEVTDDQGTRALFRDEPVVIRFKGAVPAYILVPHIFLMFFAMFFSNLTGIMSVVKYPRYKRYGIWTLILLLIGGMILGPLVQYHAFGELWTGVPYGWDLTDNKTLIAVLFWILAVAMNRKKDRPGYTLLAAFVLLLVYSIPHSLFGSELDYASGEVTQG
jgi:hypothetical protein